MAKIAIPVQQALKHRAEHGAAGETAAQVVARGRGWSAADVLCTRGPHDRPFEERHSHVVIAVVAAGTFQYRSESGSGLGRELMTPGAVVLGGAGRCFECAHDHGAGDRCLSFWYSPDYFGRIAADVGGRGGMDFRSIRVPPLRTMSPLVAKCWAALADTTAIAWEELALETAAQVAALVTGSTGQASDAGQAPPNAMARVAETVRLIEHEWHDAPLALDRLAELAGLSPYHFLRTFERVTGATPHQYILRTRLRHAALRLTTEPARVLDVALDSGFGDVSNFNRAFRAEFGVSPRAYRRRSQ